MHRSRAPLRGQGVFSAAQFSAGYITNMPAFDLRQAQPTRYSLALRGDTPPGRAGAEGENKVTVPTRFRGKGTLLVKGAEQSPVEYEITAFEVDAVIRTEGWVEAG